jgi:hypothetical protein
MSINSVLNEWFYDLKQDRFSLLALIAIVIGLAGWGSWWGYKTYVTRRDQAAQLILSSCMQTYQKASSQPSTQAWSEVDTACLLGYQEHSSSSLAPYFLALRADALMEQSKKDEAAAVMNQMMQKLSSSSPLYFLYKTKVALMKFDTSPQAEAVLEELNALAYDKNNKNADIALYYTGYYYFHHKDLENAQKAWNNLIANYKTNDKNTSSPWAALAEYKLQQIVA